MSFKTLFKIRWIQRVAAAAIIAAVPPIVNYLMDYSFSDKPMSPPLSSSSAQNSYSHNFANMQSFRNLVQEKERINTEIVDLAGMINNRIGANGNLIGANDLKNRAQQIMNDIKINSNQLVNSNYSSEFDPSKKLLIQLFDLELTRASSLYNGLVEGGNGQDYKSSFRVGTQASYKFDEIEAAFNREYSNLQGKIR